MNLHLLRTLRNSNEKVIYRKLWNLSLIWMSSICPPCLSVTMDNWKICCQCQTCSIVFANAAIQVMHQPASVTNQCQGSP